MAAPDAGCPSPLLPAAQLAAPSPSARDGVPAEVEFAYREFGCEVVAELCLLLRLPPAVRATAAALLQRFFHARSLRAWDAHHVAMGAVFLAGKVEEDARRMRDVVTCAGAIAARRRGERAPRAPLPLGGAVYAAWKAALMRAERFLLKDVGFQVHGGVSGNHAASFLLFFVRALGGGAPLAQAAWAALNDALQRDLGVRHAPEAVACGALLLAARETATPLPAEAWAVFGSSEDEARLVAASILELRERAAPLGWLPSLRAGAPPEDL